MATAVFIARVSYYLPFMASEPRRFRFLLSRLPDAWGSFSDHADSVVAAGPEPLTLLFGVVSLVFLTWLVN